MICATCVKEGWNITRYLLTPSKSKYIHPTKYTIHLCFMHVSILGVKNTPVSPRNRAQFCDFIGPALSSPNLKARCIPGSKYLEDFVKLTVAQLIVVHRNWLVMKKLVEFDIDCWPWRLSKLKGNNNNNTSIFWRRIGGVICCKNGPTY